MTIVVDGGGTGSRLALFDASGHLCASADSGPASLSLGESRAWDSIEQGIQKLKLSAAPTMPETATPDWSPEKLVMGLAGALQQQRRSTFLSLIPAGIEPLLVTDGHAQLLGASGGQPGICLSVGTGSVVHWLDSNHEAKMAGGWGFPAGDEASGAWLGLQSISRYLHFRDTLGLSVQQVDFSTDAQTDQSTALDPLFRDFKLLLGTDVSAIQQWSTCKNPTKLASLAPNIISAAELGSSVANGLLSDGVSACEELLSLAPNDLPIYLVGGLAAAYEKRLSTAFRSRLAQPLGDVFDGLYSLVSDGYSPDTDRTHSAC